MDSAAPARDGFGHPLDAGVGYARGAILAGPTEEALRLRHGQAMIRARVARCGPRGIGIFTGNRRELLLGEGDLPVAEEWVGTALLADQLDAAIRAHLEAPPAAATALFNRGSAALVACTLALAPGGRVLSVVPREGRSHPSLRRGAALAGAGFTEVEGVPDGATPCDLLAVTTVTSSLARLPEAEIGAAIALGRRLGAPVLLDDAYGARLRTVLHGGAPGLALGADLVVTNADKAGLPGPRAGILAGAAPLVARVLAAGSVLGLEARGPVALGVLRGLEAWSPDELREEAAQGAALAAALEAILPAGLVQRTDLGPLLPAEAVLGHALARAGLAAPPVVPVEATALLGMLLLERQGVLTTNVAGQPGAHPALRLKPAGDALERCGGVVAVARAVAEALEEVAARLHRPGEWRAALLGS